MFMLISKSPKVGDVVSIRLTTGEEIIGKLAATDFTDEIVLEKPALLHMQQTSGGLDIAFGAPLVSGSNEVIRYYTTALMFYPVATRDEIREGYQKATGSIITPSSSIIKP